MNEETPGPTFNDDKIKATKPPADTGLTQTTDTAYGHGNSDVVSKPLLDLMEGKRRRSRSQSIEKVEYLNEKENSAEEISSLEKPAGKIKRRRSRSHSVHKVKPSKTESETKELSRPQPIQIEESEEIQELELTKGRPQRKESDAELPPLNNSIVILGKTQPTKGKTKSFHAITSEKFQFSEKHQQRMKQSVFDRLAKK